MSDLTPGSKRGSAGVFFFALVVLGALRLALGFVSFPIAVVPIINNLLTAVFLGVPILALFFAAQGRWTARTALIYLIGGAAIQIGFGLLDRYVYGGVGTASGVAQAIAQIGLPTWCAGLGALVALKINDKNMLVPLAIFLAFFDAFMVFSDFGVANRVIHVAPEILNSVAAQIPKVGQQPATGKAELGFVNGPADYVFLAMYFVVLFRFGMRTARTLALMIPVLIAYMLIVVLTGKPLPALIPMGAVVLAANWTEFRLTRDEIVATGVATVLGAGLYIWGMTVPKSKTMVIPAPRNGTHKSPRPQPRPSSWV